MDIPEKSPGKPRPNVFCLEWTDEHGKKQRRFYLSRQQAEQAARELTAPFEVKEQSF